MPYTEHGMRVTSIFISSKRISQYSKKQGPSDHLFAITWCLYDPMPVNLITRYQLMQWQQMRWGNIQRLTRMKIWDLICYKITLDHWYYLLYIDWATNFLFQPLRQPAKNEKCSKQKRTGQVIFSFTHANMPFYLPVELEEGASVAFDGGGVWGPGALTVAMPKSSWSASNSFQSTPAIVKRVMEWKIISKVK